MTVIFDQHDHRVDPGALLHAEDEEPGNDEDDQDCREVDDPAIQSRGVDERSGKDDPDSARRVVMYPDHPTATAAIETEYSRIRSHPMIHAQTSPSEAYPYV